MGVVKSGSKVSRNNSPSHTQSSSSTDDELQQKENHMYPDDSGAESDTTDESDVPEVGSELCMVGDQTCSIPYDLFDLKDLKQVLSLESWNSELTDEDRYNLSAYLPDLDQQAYNLTMKQLLGGENLDFNSPMVELFEMLKGGLCAPKVSRYRQALQFLQKKEHYHNLRKYHNNMVNTFYDMRKIWKTSPGAGVEERIRLWNSWRSQKKLSHGEPTAVLTFPKQGEASRKSKSGRPPTQSTKKAKTTKSQGVTDVVCPPYQVNTPTTTKADGKGVLKVKPPAKSPILSESNISKTEYKETLRMPRGVLKITPKNHGRQEQCQMKLDNVPFVDMQNYENQARPSLHSQAMGAWEGDSYIGETSIGQSKNKDRKKRTTLEPPDGAASLPLPFEYFTNTGPGKSVSTYDKKMKKLKEQEMFNTGMQMPSWYRQDARKFEEDDNPAGGNRFTNDFSESRRYAREAPMFSEHTPYADQHWKHLENQNREYPRSSMEHYADIRDWKSQNFHQSFSNERRMNYSNREPDLEGPGNIHGEQNLFLKSMDRSKKKRKEPRQSVEDSLRLSNEQRHFAEGYGDRHDYLKEQSNFVGNRRQVVDGGGYFEDAKWSDQGKYFNEPRRRKQSQIGDFALELERNVEEPMMPFEGSQISKKNKRKKEHEKVEAMDFFPTQPAIRHEYDVKGADGFDKKKSSVKFKIKAGARSSDVLADTNGPQDRTQSS